MAKAPISPDTDKQWNVYTLATQIYAYGRVFLEKSIYTYCTYVGGSGEDYGPG